MELVAATHNKGKLREFGRILEPLGIQVIPQDAICPGLLVEENGTTFAANARLKAEAVFRATGRAAVADDSGLCVDALGGAPGVYSARYAGPGATDSQRVQKLLEELAGVLRCRRTARFVSAICCFLPDGSILSCEGTCEGVIGWEPLGEGGFGYDPVFMVGERSFSQLSGGEKDAVSHRGKALRLFYELFRNKLKGDNQC